MIEYEGGTKVEVDQDRLAILVYDDPDYGSFEVVGFESLSDIETFLHFGDFTPGKDNDFFTIAKKKFTLTWIDKN